MAWEDPNQYDVADFLSVQQWALKEQGGQLRVEFCPYCGKDKYHFYINKDNGLFDCKSCGQSGNLWALKRDFGANLLTKISTVSVKKEEKYPTKAKMRRAIKALWENPSALAYLKERAITEHTIKRFSLGLSDGGDIAIPIVKDGKLVNIKYRTIPPKKKFYMRETGCPSYLFNGDAIERDKSVVLTEGEFDAIIAEQYGFIAVSGITGAQGLVAEEMKQLDKAEKVIVIYDNDEAGQKGAKQVIERIGFERCYNVVLPKCKDLTEFCQGGGTKEELQEIVRNADKVKPDDVFRYTEMIDDVFSEENKAGGIKTGYDKFDEGFSGFGPGKLTIIAADTRIGKSTMAVNMFKNMADRGLPVLVFSLENQPQETVRRLTTMILNKPLYKVNKNDVSHIKDRYTDWPFYMYFSGERDVTIQGIKEICIQAKKYYNVQAIMIDHIHFFARSITNSAQEISFLVLQLKKIAVGLGIPVIAISHISRKGDANSNVPNIHDLKGSSSIEQDADQVLMLWRNMSPIDNPELMDEMDAMEYAQKQRNMMLRVHKDRNGCGFGDYWFDYDMDTGNIREKLTK